MHESVLKLPWGGNAGVIAYGSAPLDGHHRLLSFPAGASDFSQTEGTYVATGSTLQRLFLGENHFEAAPGSGHTSSMFEFILYEGLLSAAEMAEISKRLSAFYFTPSAVPEEALR